MLLSQVALRARRIRVVLNWENSATAPGLDLILVFRGNSDAGPGSAYAIHFAAPAGPDGAIRHLGRTGAAVMTERAEIDLDALRAEGDQVLLSLSASGGRLADTPGELYRRRESWFHRTAGFGVADGLAGLGSRFAVPRREAAA
ncbi:TerD family protein [Frankia tisae]|uniref:TerD family protein n=1 Tax=Frankia tisae TaxID=2950104 RepID=UPI003557485A